jgi:para-nitrobenzyl esterase
VRSADHHGAPCPQLASPYGNTASETEDCLVLEVYRPAGTRPGTRLPVFFWIHGGALQIGSADGYDGSTLARETGAVVVTINYRLGVFGFLGHPALTAEAGESGNYGLDDQQAALRWVHRNIGAFGGDPRAVTIGGESAGGWSVCAHLTSPHSRGLFAGAIIQSGGCVSGTQADSEAAGTAAATQVGCTDVATALACLRSAPVARLLATTPTDATLFTRGTSALPRDPRVAVATGAFTRVPVIIGANRDEGRLFTVANIGWTRKQYEDWVAENTGPLAGTVLAHYPWPPDADQFTPAYLTGAITTDTGLGVGLGGCPGRLLAHDLGRRTPTYTYQFDHRTGPGIIAGPPGFAWGAGHAAELQYFWPAPRRANRPLNAAELRLAEQMRVYWGAFIRTGRPAARHQAAWTRHGVLSLRAGPRSRVISDRMLAAQHQCEFWDHVAAAGGQG